MDVYALGKNIGLYDWKYYVNDSGSWVLRQESVINQLIGQKGKWEGSASGDASRPPQTQHRVASPTTPIEGNPPLQKHLCKL
jgi:hypothetical protein